jgi:hypothetical protein
MFQPGFLEQDNSEIILKVKKKSNENKSTLSRSMPWVNKKVRDLLRWVKEGKRVKICHCGG